MPRMSYADDLSPDRLLGMSKKDDDLETAWVLSSEVSGISPRTIARRRVAVRSWRKFLYPLPLSSGTAAAAEEWLAGYPGLATRHAYRADVGILYKWAVRRGVLKVNPFIDVPSVRVPKGVPRPFTHDEIRRLLNLHLQPPYSQMLRLGLFAGLRVSEIGALGWEDIHPTTLTVRNGKGGKSRVLPIHPELSAVLQPLKSRGPVITVDGKPLNGNQVGKCLKSILQVVGMDGVPHQLRHSYATELARASGGDMLLVATLMGHASPSTSMVYAQLAGGEASRIVELMWAA